MLAPSTAASLDGTALGSTPGTVGWLPVNSALHLGFPQLQNRRELVLGAYLRGAWARVPMPANSWEDKEPPPHPQYLLPSATCFVSSWSVAPLPYAGSKGIQLSFFQ